MAKKKAGDQRGAVMALKQMKMFEGELTKLDGQQIMLEQQKMTIQSTAGDYEVIINMKEANEKIKEMNEVVNADTVAEVQENLAENMQ